MTEIRNCRSLFTAAAFAFATLASFTPAYAADPANSVSGLYQNTQNGLYYSIHQNGDIVRIGEFGSLPALSQYGWLLTPDGKTNFFSSALSFWAIYAGPIQANGSAQVSGEALFGTCMVNMAMQRNSDGSILLTRTGNEETAFGRLRQVTCDRRPGQFTIVRVG